MWTEVTWLLASCVVLIQGEPWTWKSKEYEAEIQRTSCAPFQHYTGTTLTQHSKAGNISMLGKVVDIEVCALLCCEVSTCDIAMLEGTKCSAIACFSKDSCETSKSSSSSQLVLMKRKDGTDVFSQGRDSKEVTADKYDQENKSTIVTKQAAVQKSSIPQNQAGQDDKPKDSLVAITNKDKGDSPMDQLLQSETAMVKSKFDSKHLNNKAPGSEVANDSPNHKTDVKEKSSASVKEKVQDVTESHYLKVDEKGDVTALQENDTRTDHPQLKPPHTKDLRHTLISPITIGAFTCMAVIAVSGFAMAIIKYQREQKDMQDKQTQQP